MYRSAAIAAFSFFLVLEKLYAPAAAGTFNFKFFIRGPVPMFLFGAFMHFVILILMDFFGLCTNHRKQHFEFLAGIDRMGHVGRHYDYLAL
jgi:hypothetical protein